MHIELRPIDSITPYPQNPRDNAGAVDAVADSIPRFGFRQPIVVDREAVVIVGHTRLLAARKLGLTEVPVHVADLTPEQAKAYRLMDNQSATFSTWDYDLLAGELRGLEGMNFEITSLGFSEDERRWWRGAPSCSAGSTPCGRWASSSRSSCRTWTSSRRR